VLGPIRKNLLANLIGKVWSALIALAVIPLHLHYLGLEAYALTGIFLSIVSILSLLDLGLGNALNQQLARYALNEGNNAQEMHDLVRTLEIIYCVIGLLAGLFLSAMAPVLATHWIRPDSLSPSDVSSAILLMGLVLACQWPRGLYYAGLMGLQKQVSLNVAVVLMATFTNAGGVIVLWLISPTVDALLTWYIAAGLLETIIARELLKRRLPGKKVLASFSKPLLFGVWRFAAGMTGVSILSVLLTQIDKIILSHALSLEAFGYYVLAWRLAACLYYVTGPVTNSLFPRFSQLALEKSDNELSELYHKGCQFMAVLLLPAAATLMLFPKEILFLWTRNPLHADGSASLLAILAFGTALNGIMALPATLQFAHSWTKLILTFNSVVVIILGPLIYFTAEFYGPVGAAWVWLALNVTYVTAMTVMMHRRLLVGQASRWYRESLLTPIIAVSLSMIIFRFVDPRFESQFMIILFIGTFFLVSLSATILVTPKIRKLVSMGLRKLKRGNRIERYC
jgi:O-antigen/teichoic acid export membrane protein